ncbi:MAG: UBP-type zinc finger domain-containing protein [Actinomycetota bacterium]
MAETCEHLQDIQVRDSDVRVCEACLAIGSRWVHLRLCLNCGNVGCCDSSPNKHASKHFAAAGHPVIRSLEPGEGWAYCYADDLWVESV